MLYCVLALVSCLSVNVRASIPLHDGKRGGHPLPAAPG
jgi:hypothetical protein